jgi:hypothetical protein
MNYPQESCGKIEKLDEEIPLKEMEMIFFTGLPIPLAAEHSYFPGVDLFSVLM